jgi:hypothetical protein
MKLTYLSNSFFPFPVPEKDSSFVSSVGPQTVYPAGFSLERALQIYWRAQTYQLIATANGTLGHVTQALATSGPLPVRNAVVGTDTFFEIDGLALSGPGDLVTGLGLRQIIPGGGTITSTGTGTTGSNPAAVFDFQVNLFYPEIFAADPVIKYAGQWWPAMSVSCSTTNTVTLDGGGELEIAFACDTYDPSSTTEIGAFTFFGVSVPVRCADLAPGETRTVSGSIAVVDEWA